LFTYLKRGKKTYISNLVFLTLENLAEDLNSDYDPTDVDNLPVPNSEVELAWWVPWSIFYKPLDDRIVKNDSHRHSAN
jgi:hypothetical protein